MPIRKFDFVRLIKTMVMLVRVWLIALLVGLYSLIPVFKEYSPYETFADIPSDVFTVLGLVLSLVLVFRTNRAYDRWWEARTIWGKLVNISRNLAIKCRTFAKPDLAERQKLHLIAGSYRSYAIKCLTLYLLALPWGLVQDLQWLTVPISMIVTYIMFGLESIADAVEEPFGLDLDDLNLDALCATIDRTTAEILDVPQGEC